LENPKEMTLQTHQAPLEDGLSEEERRDREGLILHLEGVAWEDIENFARNTQEKPEA